MVSDVLLSVDQILANAKAAADAKAAGKTDLSQLSAVGKLLAARENPVDVVELSPVQKLLQVREEKAAEKSYFESDSFFELKVRQLRGQLAVFSNLPGLDPDGTIIDRIQKEIGAIISIQQGELADLNAEEEKAAAELEEKQRLAAQAPPSVDSLLQRASDGVNGITPPVDVTPEAQALLDGLGSIVNTTA